MLNDYIWEGSYCYIYTEVQRWAMPPLMATLYGGLGYAMWWASKKLRWHPVVTFAVLGAALSIPDHFYAITVKGLLETPLLKEVSNASAFVFGIFEFVFYWILIISIAIVVRSAIEWWTRGRQNPYQSVLRS